MSSPVRRVALACLLLGIPAAVSAQVQYDANCKHVSYTEDQVFQQEVCKTHAGCLMVAKGLEKFCRSVDFLKNLGDRLTGNKPPDNEDVIEASEPIYPRSSLTEGIMGTIRRVTGAGYQLTPQTSTFQTEDGRTAYVESRPDAQGNQAGAIIYSDGSRARGAFNASLMPIAAEVIEADGRIRAGFMSSNKLHGLGFTTEPTATGTDVYEGTFDNNRPVGEVVHRFPNGTSVREIWRDGQMIERGKLAAKGSIPPPVHTLPDGQREAASGTKALERSEGLESSLEDTWRGDTSGNVVRLVKRAGGYDVSAVITNPNQTQSIFYRQQSDGSLVYSFPDGNQSVAQPLADGTIRLSQPGFTDIFRRQSDKANKARSATPEPPNSHPLTVRGPPWLCPTEIDAYMQAWGRRTGGQGVLSPGGFWQSANYSPVVVLITTLTAYAVIPGLYQQYAASTPGLRSQPLAFTVNSLQYREGYFRSRQSMLALAEALEARRLHETKGGEGDTLAEVHACIARYLAKNARN